MTNANLALRIRNLVLDFFGYIKFLNIAILNQKNLILALSIILTLLLPPLPIFLITLPLLVNIKLSAKKLLIVIVNRGISGITI